MKLKVRHKKTYDENLIPMINIVFLMLIFFLVAGAIRSFSKKDIVMPEGVYNQQQKIKSLKIQISKTSGLYVNSEPVQKKELKNYLEQYILEWGEDVSVAIIPDKDLLGKDLFEILEIIKTVKIKTVNIIALRKSGR